MKKIFVSVPFAGRTEEEVRREIQILQNEYMKTHGYTLDHIKNKELCFVDNYDFDPRKIYSCFVTRYRNSLVCLSNALLIMSRCDDAIFSKNWESARGCRIEHLAYELYMKESS